MSLADRIPVTEVALHPPVTCHSCGAFTVAWTIVGHAPGISGPGRTLYACPQCVTGTRSTRPEAEGV